MSYDTVVFDNDGVLTEPTPTEIVREAVRDAFGGFDVEPSPEDVDAAVGGDLEAVREACRRHGVDVERFWPRREARAIEAQKAAIDAGRKGLFDDVEALEEFDATRAVVSNNQHGTVEYILDAFDLRDLFAVAFGRSPTVAGFRNRKPSPTYLDRAADLVEADSALYVGDSEVDVIAARRAGMDVAFVRRAHRRGYDLSVHPTYEIESLSELPSIVGSDAAASD